MLQAYFVSGVEEFFVVCGSVSFDLYGDNVFKKTGINREGAGKHKKTRHFGGKQSIFNRDRL